jgi:hypothetical protein
MPTTFRIVDACEAIQCINNNTDEEELLWEKRFSFVYGKEDKRWEVFDAECEHVCYCKTMAAAFVICAALDKY